MWRIGRFLKKCREKTIALLERIPRKLQVFVNLLLIPVLLFMMFVFLDCPVLDDHDAYRRIEKANMVGPAEILGYEAFTEKFYENVVLADAGDAVIIAAIPKNRKLNIYNNYFFYLPKTDDIIISPVPEYLSWGDSEVRMSLFLFDEYPEAVRAEVDLEVFWNPGGDEPIYYETHRLEAVRNNDGYFRLDVQISSNQFEVDPAAEAIIQLSHVAMNCGGWTLPEDAYPATVRLYDVADRLVVEKQMQLYAQNG